MNFKGIMFIFFIISSTASAYCMNIKTNLINAVNRLDVNRIATLLAQGANNLSYRDKTEILQAFSRYGDSYSEDREHCSHKFEFGIQLTGLMALTCFICYILQLDELPKKLEQKEEDKVALYISHLNYYSAKIFDKSIKTLKYFFGGVSLGYGIFSIVNIIRYLYLDNLIKKRWQIKQLFARNGISAN